jgi:hypothetical protein
MEGAYHIDSDSEEEEEDAALPKGAAANLHDIEKLKAQTQELLDPSWKEDRNKHLLIKMLDLEEPSITAKVSDEG